MTDKLKDVLEECQRIVSALAAGTDFSFININMIDTSNRIAVEIEDIRDSRPKKCLVIKSDPGTFPGFEFVEIVYEDEEE